MVCVFAEPRPDAKPRVARSHGMPTPAPDPRPCSPPRHTSRHGGVKQGLPRAAEVYAHLPFLLSVARTLPASNLA